MLLLLYFVARWQRTSFRKQWMCYDHFGRGTNVLTALDVPLLRSWLWRIGRGLYMYARRDAPNDPGRNGEYWLLDLVVSSRIEGEIMLLDVGANRGEWSHRACELMREHSVVGTVFAVEPPGAAAEFLRIRFRDETSLHILPVAMSDKPGDADFFVIGAMAGTNSLLDSGLGTRVRVPTTTVDEFCRERSIHRLLFVKTDTEGNDMAVLRGAARSLYDGIIDVWQFEYNHRWAFGRYLLKDVFEFIQDKPYTVGKLYGYGIEKLKGWHPELERFFEGNYVLLRKGSTLDARFGSYEFDSSNALRKTSAWKTSQMNSRTIKERV